MFPGEGAKFPPMETQWRRENVEESQRVFAHLNLHTCLNTRTLTPVTPAEGPASRSRAPRVLPPFSGLAFQLSCP